MNRRSVSVAAVLLASCARAALAAPSTVLSATCADRPRRPGHGGAVRSGAALPDISNAEAVKRAVLEADSLVFNRASTGLYFEALLNTMGLHAQALPKSTSYPDGVSVMEHVRHGQGRGIGFGAITEIVLLRDKGLQLWLRCRWSCRTSPPTPRRP